MQLLLARAASGAPSIVHLDAGVVERVAEDRLAARVAELEADEPRWVWSDTRHWYRPLLAAGVRVERCHDLRLARAILRASAAVDAYDPEAGADAGWEAPPEEHVPTARHAATPLFELGEFEASAGLKPPADLHSAAESMAEHERQEAALEAAGADASRLRLLLAAESAGALVAAEIHAGGIPWRRDAHESVLVAALGDRPPVGRKPRRLEELQAEIGAALDGPVQPDSQADLLRALRRAGLTVRSTRAWELQELDHPAIAPLLEYKKLARLLSANGWHWLDEWVRDGRFRPDYLPGGVVTGRWATRGGGALQLPKAVRGAVVADPGWRLVVADVAQLEPRVLAAMAGDDAMAEAARGRDLYDGIVQRGVVATRDEAKVAMLGAMYGASSGDGGRLAPRLGRAYPRAMGLVDEAAQVGERGGVVSTLLGRSSPLPSADWRALQSAASQPDATPADERRARTAAREWGRFTRNFVVQGTAAEWALCWLAEIRIGLHALGPTDSASSGTASGPVFAGRAHLVYFLHDEVIVHAPAEQAEAAADVVRAAAERAAELLFGDAPVDFPLDLAVVERYADA
ncbi:bifunctional 3'-5' exonuclease/DNA polymerase [Agromyces rhizosphaerae]|uniref:DNA-directed DNA polymerase n=1 Tax=Agromyces rhizosphaerae TaxID=88374 RepID=A0A9W6D1C8_9MICO|nr:bifunctional 3'-5' exonuclease/DNA polymerase [Agromyces rhizosphaerae]GLI29002.1 bifunctional 3'-5' exonuclease/DNA polymerase [Agromyces rhizosphaerae]